jgi:hypothetical protein
MSMPSALIWQHLWQERGAGIEHLSLGPTEAEGTIVWAEEGAAYRLSYRVRWDERWHTRGLSVALLGPEGTLTRVLDGDGEGVWRVDDAAAPHLDGCVDVDLWPTPFTNTLPVRRLGLAEGAGATIRVAYVEAPALVVRPEEQRYVRIGAGAFRFQSLSDGFTAEVRVDERGLVTSYHGLFERLA